MPSVVRKLEHDPPPLHLRCPVPRSMADVIMAALDREPTARPTADQFAQRLAATDEIAVVAPPPPSSKRIARIAVGVALIAVCLLAFAILTRVRDTSEPKPAVFASPRVNRPTTPKPKPPVVAPAPAPEPTPIPEPAAPEPPAELAAPTAPDPWTDDRETSQLFDHDGNLVDDDTAKKMLQELERDARTEIDGVRRSDRRGKRRWRPRAPRDPFY